MSPEEFTEFYNASFRRLVGQLYAMTGDNAEAQDAVQEAFIRAWEHRRKLDRDGAPEAWVRVTAWRIAMSPVAAGPVRPAAAERPAPAADGARAGSHAGGSDRGAAARTGRAAPGPGVSTSAICRSTRSPPRPGWPPGTVKSRLARGRANLAGLLHDGSGQEVTSV